MNHDTSRGPDASHRRTRVDVPYPSDSSYHYPSPPHFNMSARQYSEPELHRADSFGSGHSHQRQEEKHYAQRPRSPPTDPPTPPMSRQGSFHDFNGAWQPQAESAIPHARFPRDHLDHDDSTVIFTPESSPEGGQDRKSNKNNGYSDSRGTEDEPVRKGKYPVPSADTRVFSRNGPNGQKEWYDQEGRLTDAEGIIVLHEPEDTSSSQISDWGRDRRHHRKPTFDDLPSLDDFADKFHDQRGQHVHARDDRSDSAHRQGSATKSYKTEHRSPRDTMPDRTEGGTSFAGAPLGNLVRYPRKAVKSRDSRSSDYDSSSSESLKKTYKQAPRRNVQAQPGRDYRRARSSKYVVSPPQSVSPPRSSRIDSRSANHPGTNDAITVTGENGELKYAYLTKQLPRTARSTRDRSVSPQKRDQTRYSDHRARSRSPLSSDSGGDTPRDRSRDRNGSVQSIRPRRSRSQDMTLIILMVPNPKSRALESDSSDSWEHSKIDQSLLNGKTYAPGTLLRKQNDMTVIGMMEDVLDDLKGRKPTTSGSKNTIMYDMGN
jgi:hypothetical protein